jgi:hypothetical protein
MENPCAPARANPRKKTFPVMFAVKTPNLRTLTASTSPVTTVSAISAAGQWAPPRSASADGINRQDGMDDDYSFTCGVFRLGVAKIFINIGYSDSGATMFDAHVVEALLPRRRPSIASLLNLDIGAMVRGAPKQENKPHRSCCRYANELNRRPITQSGGRFARGGIPSHVRLFSTITR